MSWDLRGRTVFVTGAARGIGAETARRAAAAGAKLALVGLEPEELERVAAQCGADAAAFECDVTDWEALDRAAQGAVERFGGIDVVMANAGIAPAGMGVAYFGFIDTDMVRGADAHPTLAQLGRDGLGPVGRTYPVSAVGKAVVAGMQKRSRSVVVPPWVRLLIGLRTLIQPLAERGAYDRAAEADRLFAEDIEQRGVAVASAPVGAGGRAASP